MDSIPRPHTPRIRPVENPPPAVATVLEGTMAGGDGTPLNIFGTLAHHPALLSRFSRFGGFLLNKGLLPGREREIVILRVGRNCGSVYEFGQHTLIGLREGLTEAEISSLAGDPSAHPWSAADRDLIDMCDELCAGDCVSDDVWGRLAAVHAPDVLVELVVVAGFYRLVSGFLNTMGVQLDVGVPGWPGE